MRLWWNCNYLPARSQVSRAKGGSPRANISSHTLLFFSLYPYSLIHLHNEVAPNGSRFIINSPGQMVGEIFGQVKRKLLRDDLQRKRARSANQSAKAHSEEPFQAQYRTNINISWLDCLVSCRPKDWKVLTSLVQVSRAHVNTFKFPPTRTTRGGFVC